ncbi:MAG TPA: hypothetical protein VGO68_04925 [Pyrinomonadaceae bacterium]|nr:hypothetical protein [Pyrinomonadaceae bacterium]
MPEKETLERAQQDKEEGKAPSTQAGEFVHEDARRQAWRAFNQASDSHWSFESATRGSGPGATEEGIEADTQTGGS